MSGPTRRRFLQQVAWAGLGGYVAFAGGACKRRRESTAAAPPEPPRDLDQGYLFFTPPEYLTVCAACERILPADEDPGAVDLGVPRFVDRALALDDYGEWRAPFRAGLSALDAESQRRHGKRFDDARDAEQDALLADWQERGRPAEREFFRMLLHLTLEGAFGDPIYGGNADGRGFALVGFHPGPPMPGMRHG
jgi:gluconate 2-dehydrogenase gamma chain